MGKQPDEIAFMTTHIAGVHHRVKDPSVLAQLDLGQALSLEPEPTNPYDRNAIRVMFGELHLGYLPATWAPMVGVLLGGGYRVGCRVDVVDMRKSLVAIRLTLPRVGSGVSK